MTTRRKRPLMPIRTLPDARGIIELTTGRTEILQEIANEMTGRDGRDLVELHRRHCQIVRLHDGDVACTCLPLALYFGAVA